MTIRNRASDQGKVISSQTLTVDNATAAGLTVPSGAIAALITGGSVDARFRSDGTDPTATVGHVLGANASMEVFEEELDDIKFISTSTTNAALFITYYGDI